MAPVEEGSSAGEAVSGLDGEFSSGETGTTFMGRCSGEVRKDGTKVREREDLEMGVWESCVYR